MNKTLMFFLALLLVFSGAVLVVIGGGWYRQARRPTAETRTVAVQRTPLPEGWLDDFTLIERSGREFDSRDWRGSVWVASFFFSTCPHNCRRQNETFAELHDELAQLGVKFVSISCDPETDTPQRLNEYARDFTVDHEGWMFLTGPMADVRRIGAEKFFTSITEKSHTDKFIVVDKWGNLRASVSWQDPQEMGHLRTLLKELVQEEAPPVEDAQPGQLLKPLVAPAPSARPEVADEDDADEDKDDKDGGDTDGGDTGGGEGDEGAGPSEPATAVAPEGQGR